MTHDDIRAAVMEELERHAEGGAFAGRDVTTETRLDSLGIDSMTAVSVLSSLEARLTPTYDAGFRMTLPQTVGDIVDVMTAHCLPGPAPGKD